MPDPRVFPNGIDARTGQYLVPPLTTAEVAGLARGRPLPKQQTGWLRGLLKRLTDGRLFGLPADVDPADATQAGWAVVFPFGTPAAVHDHLRPLLDHRRRQVGDLYKELQYRPGESRGQWLARHGASGSDVEPGRVPYYLLLVGHPGEIPFEFQYELDVDYAVGRVAFDRPEDYAAYARAVVGYESGDAVPATRSVTYWGTRHDGDRATELSADCLITPLAEGEPASGSVPARGPQAGLHGYASRVLKGPDATKAALLDVLCGRDRPAVLFTASHGVGGRPPGDPRQFAEQGALLCQDWAGAGGVEPAHYLTAAELPDGSDFRGMVAFVFACYGAGTPGHDPFLQHPGAGPRAVAGRPFVSALAQRLLAGGALAVIGHVERAWAYSIRPPDVGAQLMPFRNLLGRVLAGEPAGHATLDFSQRYATASVELANLLDPSRLRVTSSTDAYLALAWLARNDAQNYVTLGDPAVRLRGDGPAAASTSLPEVTAAPPVVTQEAAAAEPGGATGTPITPPTRPRDACKRAAAGPGTATDDHFPATGPRAVRAVGAVAGAGSHLSVEEWLRAAKGVAAALGARVRIVIDVDPPAGIDHPPDSRSGP